MDMSLLSGLIVKYVQSALTISKSKRLSETLWYLYLNVSDLQNWRKKINNHIAQMNM